MLTVWHPQEQIHTYTRTTFLSSPQDLCKASTVLILQMRVYSLLKAEPSGGVHRGLCIETSGSDSATGAGLPAPTAEVTASRGAPGYLLVTPGVADASIQELKPG